jgi:hypothetical protein
MVLILTKDKITKNKVVRYADEANHNLYLKPDEAAELDNPESLKVTLEKSS